MRLRQNATSDSSQCDKRFVIMRHAIRHNATIDFRSIQHARDELKMVIMSLPHEMDKLEDFFEEVPVLDLFYLEVNGSDIIEEGSDEIERERRNAIEIERLNAIDVIYQPTDQQLMNDVIVDLVVKIHCDQSISGDVMVFMATNQVSDA